MTTVHDYMIVPPGKKSVIRLIADQTQQKETEVLRQAAEDLHCPNEQFVWTSRYIECRELPARVILWGIDKLFPNKEAQLPLF